ncbi:MAG: serine acetyltransferase, partial [Negativicutes bacterium]|nr:serine acetyltransferase [Negativicutes bacterium]
MVNYSLSLEAVWSYRLANQQNYFEYAQQISYYSKKNTGVEINPKAVIGANFAIDHGFGTVIGEDVVIGN